MSGILEYFGRQCGDPHGVVGRVMTWAMNRVNNEMYRAILNEMNECPDDTVLEIGFGNGYLTDLICRQKKCTVYGIDISEDMVNAASSRCRKAVADGKIKLAIGDCCALEYEDEMFDTVVTMNTIYFWSDTKKGMSEICRTMKKGGVFINAVFNKEDLKKVAYTKNVFRFFDEDDYTALGKEAGFSEVTLKKINEQSTLVICVK